MTRAPGPDPVRWRQLEAIVDGALDLAPGERSAHLDRACAGDAELRAEAERWLAACEQTDGFLEQPAGAFGAALVESLAGGPAGDDEPEPGSADSPAAPNERAAGEAPVRAGPYRIGRRLGRGGMGAVYEADRDDGHFRQRVAVKVIHRGLHADESLVGRFLAERQILAKLEHPNIARLLDGGVTADGRPYFAMEYVDGQPVDRYCDERRLPLRERLELFAAVCTAVQHAHDLRIVHRDLKPSNILVTPGGVVKLLDFGIAKLIAEEETAGLTRTGVRLLTPEYASPEQVRGQEVTPATDVYALGVLLYRLLSGRSPYGRQSARHTLEKAIVEADPISLVSVVDRANRASTTDPSAEDIAGLRGTTLDRLRRSLRGDLTAIALTALRKDPADRYPNAEALAEDVLRHLRGQPVHARAPGVGYRARRMVRRHRMSLAAAGFGVVATLGLLAATGVDVLRGRTASAADSSAGPAAQAPEARVLAIAAIADHREAGGALHAEEPLADMLATSLARVPGLLVVSGTRMAEFADSADPSRHGAARRAGATEVVEGALFAPAPGLLRLDLRRVDLRSGAIIAAHSATGADLFAVADSATQALLGALGHRAPAGSVSDVTTSSIAAYRLYVEGLREWYQGSRATAERLFGAALAEDSTFAMAAFYHSLAPNIAGHEVARRMARAEQLAHRVPERERLIILGAAARTRAAPTLGPIGDSLIARHPEALEGYLYSGVAHMMQAEHGAAIARFRRLIEFDTVGISIGDNACAACLGYQELVAAYMHADSFPAALRAAERGAARYPTSVPVIASLARAQMHSGRFEEAFVSIDRAVALNPSARTRPHARAHVWMLADQPHRAEPLVAGDTAASDVQQRRSALWVLVLSLRQQGRLQDALAVARRYREVSTGATRPLRDDAASNHAFMEAHLLFELGRGREAAALFDSTARWSIAQEDPAVVAARRIWALAQRATVLASIGDTAPLTGIAEEMVRLQGATATARSRTLHHYVRGLLLLARGDLAAAERELRIPYRIDPALGFSRVNTALAEVYLRAGRAPEAVTVLQAALRNAISGSGTYLSRGEAHERLALAWEAAGGADSARVHWGLAARNWMNADRLLQPRVERARTRAAGAPATRVR